MRGIQFSKQAIFSILIISVLSLLLTGCLVENSDPPPVIERSTDQLRLIQPGERLVYRLTGQRSINNVPNTITGTMTVTWTDVLIPDPYNPSGTINVLREESVVSFDQGGISTTVRYITQDQNDGSLFVHGYYDGSDIVYTGDLQPSPYTYQPIEFVTSPLTMANSAFSYRVLTDCGLSLTCMTSLRAISEAVEYNSEAVLTIEAGRRYNTLYYVYTTAFQEANTVQLPIPLDYRRAFCGSTVLDFFGEYYYFPEVGLVQFQSACTGVDDANNELNGHNIRGSLLSASFPIP